ncbi:MAG: response regulator transcription factor [Burkholderiales bacterium]
MALVLVIEDDPTQRLLIVAVLKSAGHEVVEAHNGEQGLSLASLHQPELVVCDVVMPGMNGYQFVSALKLEPELSTVPIIMLTAMADRTHTRIGMTSGADDYLTKPFSAPELRQAASALLAKQDRTRAQYARTFKQQMMAALDQQKDDLARQYEARLHEALSGHWSPGKNQSAELAYDNATVLLIDLFASCFIHLPGRLPSAEVLGSAASQIYHSASDALYLFGAKLLVPVGNDLLAVFTNPEEPATQKLRWQALRAAFGLQQALKASLHSFATLATGSVPTMPTTVSLHQGGLTLLRVTDPLHGGESSTLATGPAISVARALSEHGRSRGWSVCCSAPILEGLSELLVTGQRGLLPNPQNAEPVLAVELRSLVKA